MSKGRRRQRSQLKQEADRKQKRGELFLPLALSFSVQALNTIDGAHSHYPSLVAQRLKRLPAIQETQVRSLGWEDPLEKEMATYFSILPWRIPGTEEPEDTAHGVAKSWT